MDPSMTLLDAAGILETCAYEYLRRHTAFARLQQAVLLSLQTHEALAATQETLEEVRTEVEALHALQQTMTEKMATQQRMHAQARIDMEEEYAQHREGMYEQKQVLEQEFRVWKIELSERQSAASKEHTEQMGQLADAQREEEKFLSALKQEVATMRERVRSLLETGRAE